MTAAPTMKTAASEIPSEEIPSIGTGCASTKVAATSNASTPPTTPSSGLERANDDAAAVASANPDSATGMRIGKSRAVSRDTSPPGFLSPDALSCERSGRTFMSAPAGGRVYQAQPSASPRNEASRAAMTATYASLAFQCNIPSSPSVDGTDWLSIYRPRGPQHPPSE